MPHRQEFLSEYTDARIESAALSEGKKPGGSCDLFGDDDQCGCHPANTLFFRFLS